jgi:hypothetical protein
MCTVQNTIYRLRGAPRIRQHVLYAEEAGTTTSGIGDDVSLVRILDKP